MADKSKSPLLMRFERLYEAGDVLGLARLLSLGNPELPLFQRSRGDNKHASG
jgi:hypothetical protein